jgi:hypothetical protein
VNARRKLNLLAGNRSISQTKADTAHFKLKKPTEVVERVGFEALNVEPCTGLHGLVQTQETKHLYGFRLQPDLIDLF